MPRSAPVASAAGSDAVQAAYTTAARPDSVAAWYRRWFLKESWHITGDLPSPDGGVTLFVEKESRPIWLIVRPAAGNQGSIYSVVAAESGDSASRATPPAAAPKSGR